MVPERAERGVRDPRDDCPVWQRRPRPIAIAMRGGYFAAWPATSATACVANASGSPPATHGRPPETDRADSRSSS